MALKAGRFIQRSSSAHPTSRFPIRELLYLSTVVSGMAVRYVDTYPKQIKSIGRQRLDGIRNGTDKTRVNFVSKDTTLFVFGNALSKRSRPSVSVESSHFFERV